MKSGNLNFLETSEPLQACNGTALPSYLITQIEACLNSRPLIPLSSDPNDSNYLSLDYFLIGSPLTYIPEPDFTSTPTNSLSSWQQSSTLQSAVMEKVVIGLPEQLATGHPFAQKATRRPARYACAALRRCFISHVLEISNHQ